MISLTLLVLAGCTAFIYRVKHPNRVPNDQAKPGARRMRMALGLLTMIFFTAAAYLLPKEIGEVRRASEERRQQLDQEEYVQRLAAEREHVKQMIELTGGKARDQQYLNSNQATPPAN